MNVIEGQLVNWKYYRNEQNIGLSEENTGKWMYFFEPSKIDFITTVCRESIINNVVVSAKHTSAEYLDTSGVACFYIDGSDDSQHKRVLKFFLENNLIPKNKNGNYKNIAFKFDLETKQGNYKDSFKAKINLSDFVDVSTGKFIK